MLWIRPDPKAHQLCQLFKRFRRRHVQTFRTKQRIFLSRIARGGRRSHKQ